MLANVVQVIHKCEQLYGSQIFHMPAALRDKILEDPSIVNQRQLPDIDCLLSLYPQGIPQNSPIHHGRAVFLLFESAMGYSLFWAYNTLSPADLLSFESFTSVVKLIVHYPFATQAIAIQQFQHINNGNPFSSLYVLCPPVFNSDPFVLDEIYLDAVIFVHFFLYE
jgi:hypothetical protein